nr:zinc finger protein 629-like [Pelodiscus sinensis]|eukprot:XP_025045386.1 zinc finger protein 629-like [Pelodiscus sinensis]
MELGEEPMVSGLQGSRKSTIQGEPCTGPGMNNIRTPDFIPGSDSNISENEEEIHNQKDLEQDELLQVAEAQSPGWRKVRPERQQRKKGTQSTHQAKGSKKKLNVTLKRQKTPREERPYICTECGKSLKGSSTFFNHLKIHTGEKPFECTKIHTGERPYKCKDCEKSFGRSSNLMAHYKTHMKMKSYACAACSKSFTCSSALVRHQKTHTEEKPYKCTECRKSFRLSSNFIKHQKVHVRETSSECATVCHEEQQSGDAEQVAMDRSRLIFEELRRMRENMDMLLLNQQSQLQVLQEIQKQLNVLLPGNDLINSNVYNLGLLLGQQAAAVASLPFPLLLNPSNLLPEIARPFSSQIASQASTSETLATTPRQPPAAPTTA